MRAASGGALVLALGGCASSGPAPTDGLRQQWRAGAEVMASDAPSDAPALDGSLEGYVGVALWESPSLKARHAQWRAAIEDIGPSVGWPEPTLTYGFFIRQVETRVGPQRHRVGISQAIPWPGKLEQMEVAGAERARAEAARFEVEALALRRRVAEAYWALWRVRQVRAVQAEQLKLLEQLSASALARLEIGRASLADVGQIDLRRSRLADMIAQLDAAERAASARLLAAVGRPGQGSAPTSPQAPELRPAPEAEATLARIQAHPEAAAMWAEAASQDARAEAARARRWPDFMIGLDWIETGEAVMPNVPDSGKDPVIAMFSLKLPIWGDDYQGAEDASRARGEAMRHQRQDALDRAEGAARVAMSTIEDTRRRVALYQQTLVPQAEAVYGSTLGAYESGPGNVASVLLAFRELLELRLMTVDALAEHAMAWASLDALAPPPKEDAP